MIALLTSFGIIFLAEMGDKSQFLAMAFASRFRWQIVLMGAFVAMGVNLLIAVLVGKYLTIIFPLAYIKIAAALFFILFGLWTLRDEKPQDDEERRFNFSPFWTVTAAFFLAEMGDKTQFATVALAAEFNAIIPVWIGTTIGIVLADAVGIVVGIVLHKKIPEKQLKWFAALVFIAFGLWGLYDAVFNGLLH